jgi:hypothetical protein
MFQTLSFEVVVLVEGLRRISDDYSPCGSIIPGWSRGLMLLWNVGLCNGAEYFESIEIRRFLVQEGFVGAHSVEAHVR